MIEPILHTKVINFNTLLSTQKSVVVRNTYTFALFLLLIILLPSISYAEKFEKNNDSISNLLIGSTTSIYIVEGTTFSGLKNTDFTYVESKKKNTTLPTIFISSKTTFFYSKTELINFSLVHIKDTNYASLPHKKTTNQLGKIKSKEESTPIKSQNILEYPFQNPYTLRNYNSNYVFINSKTIEYSFNKQLLKINNCSSIYCIHNEKHNDLQFLENSKYGYLLVVNFYTRPPPFLS